jgi:carboxymethylenebutenolidase
MFRSPHPMATATGYCTSLTETGRGRVYWCSRTQAEPGRRSGKWATSWRTWGYVALIPDIHYRAGQWMPFDVATLFTDAQERARLAGLTSVLTNDRIIADSAAYANFLLARPEVRGSAIGTTGYCLGGRMSLIAAGGLGPKIAAAASFHGGRLAVAGDPSSPHLSADRITATVYVAAATDDDSFTTEQAELLQSALTGSGVDHTLEVYPARHGFAVPDNPTYNTQANARHWEALHQLYRTHLEDS